MKEFIDIGPAGRVARKRILAIANFSSAPIRRAVNFARKEGNLIDLTYGRACKWVFFLDSGHVVLATKTELSPKESEKN